MAEYDGSDQAHKTGIHAAFVEHVEEARESLGETRVENYTVFLEQFAAGYHDARSLLDRGKTVWTKRQLPILCNTCPDLRKCYEPVGRKFRFIIE